MEKNLKCLHNYTNETLEENLHEIKMAVKHPMFICHKCGRVSAKKELLCKPQKIDE
jgi:predicted metal-binding protein